MNKIEVNNKLKRIKEEVLDCKKCSLYKTRKYPVIGQGNHQAKIIFIGEAPGKKEDETGYPFCGRAGKILDELLDLIGIKREEIYIANILKCRPPGNRDPEEKEIQSCVSFLEKQIEIIKPEIICPLGRHAMKFLMERFELEEFLQPISKIHGQVFESKNLTQLIKIIPFYHPAVATYNPNMKDTLKTDFLKLKKFLKNKK